jgi:hypothetical protein
MSPQDAGHIKAILWHFRLYRRRASSTVPPSQDADGEDLRDIA